MPARPRNLRGIASQNARLGFCLTLFVKHPDTKKRGLSRVHLNAHTPGPRCGGLGVA